MRIDETHKYWSHVSGQTLRSYVLKKSISLIHFTGKELYWCDAQNDIIEKSDLNGNSRRVVAYLDEGAHPFGIAISTTLIYWSDWTTRNVYTMSREGQNPQALTDEGMFLRLQGMCVSSVSYPLDGMCKSAIGMSILYLD